MVEGLWRVGVVAVVGRVCAGPGAGVVVGWVLRERGMVGMERREERSLLNSGDASDGVDD